MNLTRSQLWDLLHPLHRESNPPRCLALAVILQALDDTVDPTLDPRRRHAARLWLEGRGVEPWAAQADLSIGAVHRALALRVRGGSLDPH